MSSTDDPASASSATGAIDYWCNCFLPPMQAKWQAAIARQGIPLKVRKNDDDSFADGATMVARMDDIGMDTIILPTCDLAEGEDPLGFEALAARWDDTEALATAHPGRFAGAWSIDPRTGMDGVRRAVEALEQPWCVALHIHTHSWDRPLDHADYYPYYALCADADVPLVAQVGTSGGRMPSECGRPISVDRPAIYFRSTRFVLSHTGWPWVDEALAMALKFDNVYLGTAAYPPRHWSASLVDFIGRAGRGKTMWGTSFPTVGHRHALGQLDELNLGEVARSELVGGAARRVFTRLGSLR
ncbi:MAG: amidohydrolase family protein [Acidimicrobiales bacterium]|nr:amidohydrolase family protein [Acidimicrobiales bacterium]